MTPLRIRLGGRWLSVKLYIPSAARRRVTREHVSASAAEQLTRSQATQRLRPGRHHNSSRPCTLGCDDLLGVGASCKASPSRPEHLRAAAGSTCGPLAGKTTTTDRCSKHMALQPLPTAAGAPRDDDHLRVPEPAGRPPTRPRPPAHYRSRRVTYNRHRRLTRAALIRRFNAV